MTLQYPACGLVPTGAGPPKEAGVREARAGRQECSRLGRQAGAGGRPPRSRHCGCRTPRGGTPVCGTSAPAAGLVRIAQPADSGRRCRLAPRAAAGGKMAAVKGLETCLRVAGAAAARPERFLGYNGAAGFPGGGEPSNAGPRGCVVYVALCDLCRPHCSGREASCQPAPLSYPRCRRALLKRAVNSVETWLGLLPRLLLYPIPFFSVRELGNGGFCFSQKALVALEKRLEETT